MILIALAMNSCKARKLEKNTSKIKIEQKQISVVSKKEITEENSSAAVNTDQKELVRKKEDFVKEENVIDSGVVVTEKTKVTNFDSLGRIKSISESEKIIDRKALKSDKRSAENKLSNIDKSKIDKSQSNNSQIKNSVTDSTGKQNTNLSESQSNKKLEAKPQTIKMWVGFGFFLVIIAGVGIWWFNRK
jgi:hypothetical protein